MGNALIKEEDKIAHTEIISFNGKQGEEIKHKLMRLKTPKIITEFKLKGCEITKADISLFCQFFKKMPHLKTLEFDYTKMTESEAKVIAKWLTKYSGLEHLSLYNSQIGDAGIICIIQALSSQKTSHLEKLYLNDNNISDEVAIKLGNELKQGKLPSLTMLELKDNDITDKGAGSLSWLVKEKPGLKIFLSGLSSFYLEVLVNKDGTLKPYSPDMLNPDDYEKHRVPISRVTWKKTHLENMRFFFSEPEKLLSDNSKEKVEQQQDTLIANNKLT